MNLPPGVEGLARSICAQHGVSFAEAFRLTDDGRLKSMHPRLVRARDHVFAVLRASTGWSYPDIARIFGMLDHSTIHAAVRRHELRLAVLFP